MVYSIAFFRNLQPFFINSCIRRPIMNKKVIYTTRIRFKNGTVIYARNYGIKAFRIVIE